MHHLVSPDVTDVLINGVHDVWIHRREGPRERLLGVLDCRRELEGLVRHLARSCGQNDPGPHVSVPIPGKGRLHAVLGGQIHGDRRPQIAIRLAARFRPTLAELVGRGVLPEAVAGLLVEQRALRGRSLVVSGACGSGKTTLAEAFLRGLPVWERVLIMQDVPEIQPPTLDHDWTSFGPGDEGYGPLLRSLLRLQPDRVVLGEVRGAETWELLEALTTHGGSVTTVHATSPALALQRLASMALLHPSAPGLRAVQGRVVDVFSLVLQLERLEDAAGPVRRAAALVEVLGVDGQGLPQTRALWSRS